MVTHLFMPTFKLINFRDVTPCGLIPESHKNLLIPCKFLYTD